MAPRKPRQPKGFKESQTAFGGPATATGIFEWYGSACAFTGKSLKREAAIDPRGYLLVLGANPLTTDPALLIPACQDAIHAFERGHLAIGTGYNLLVDLERIDPEFLEQLNPIGRLRLPTDISAFPSKEALAAHRLAFMEGRISRA